jgi:branched-chain amino acid transport system ATP-binding protein
MAAMAAVNLLSTRGLTRTFGGLKAVDAVDFDLAQGEIRAIIGPNGAGKTTFVGLICGRMSASAGRISFGGEDITRLPAHARVRRGIAYTFQITSVFAKLSVFDNVALAAQSSMRRRSPRWHRLDEEVLAARVADALARVGLGARPDARAGELPYGHQRLLEVAMGLALMPRLLILDEPTQGLSDSEIGSFCELIRVIAADATILLIEHNMDVVMQLAHRITVMNQGAILADGTPAEIRASAAVQRAYLGA